MEDLKKYLQGIKQVRIISAAPYDADSLSSGIILRKFLENEGFDVTNHFPRKVSAKEISFLDFLPFFKLIEFGDTRELFKNSTDKEIIIIVDGRDLIQVYDHKDRSKPEPDFSRCKIVRIDHHALPEKEVAGHVIQDTEVSSTIELLLRDIIPVQSLNSDLATVAFAGLIGDTGNFRWNVNPYTFKLASQLLEKNVDNQALVEQLLVLKDKHYMDLLSFCQKNALYNEDIKTAFLLLSKNVIEENNLKHSDIQELKYCFVEEIGKRVRGYDRGIALIEWSKTSVIASGKSTNTVCLPELFRHFGGNGQGHFNFAGAELETSFRSTYEGLCKMLAQTYMM